MSKSLYDECPRGVFVIGAISVLTMMIFGIRAAYSLPDDLEDSKCAPLQDLPEHQRKELQRQICPDWKPKNP